MFGNDNDNWNYVLILFGSLLICNRLHLCTGGVTRVSKHIRHMKKGECMS